MRDESGRRSEAGRGCGRSLSRKEWRRQLELGVWQEGGSGVEAGAAGGVRAEVRGKAEAKPGATELLTQRTARQPVETRVIWHAYQKRNEDRMLRLGDVSSLPRHAPQPQSPERSRRPFISVYRRLC